MTRVAAQPKLLACLAAILLVTAAMGGVAYSVLSQTNTTFEVAVNSTARKLWLAGDINMAGGDMLAFQRGILLYGKTPEGAANLRMFDTRSTQIDRDASELVSLSVDSDERKTIAVVEQSNASYRAAVRAIREQHALTVADDKTISEAYERIDTSTDQLEAMESNQLREALSATRRRLKYGRIGLGFVFAIGLLVMMTALGAVDSMGQSLRGSAAEASSSAAFNKLIVNSMPCAVVIIDLNGKVKRWNNNFLGYTYEDVIESGSQVALQPESLEAVKQSLARAMKFGFSETEAYMKTKDGRRIPAYLTHRQFDYEGEPCILGVGIDISKQKQAEQFSRLQRVALESASEAIVITDETGSIEWANPAFTTLTGYELEEVLGCNPRMLKSGMMNRDFYKLLWSTILKGDKWSGELWNLKKDGIVYCEEMHIAPVRAVNESISNFVAVKHDITERKQMEAQAARAKQDLLKLNQKLQDANENILRISQTDALTGLANRRTIDERMADEMARTERLGCGFSVILGDLDHFKSINDEFGHLIGDKVLMTVAKVLSEHARPYDLPARFGGEEFMVLLPESTLTDAMTIAQRIRCEVAEVSVPGIDRQITMSLGISTWGHGDTAGELIGRADVALYQAKRRGRNRVVAQTSDKPEAMTGAVMDGATRDALVPTV